MEKKEITFFLSSYMMFISRIAMTGNVKEQTKNPIGIENEHQRHRHIIIDGIDG